MPFDANSPRSAPGGDPLSLLDAIFPGVPGPYWLLNEQGDGAAMLIPFDRSSLHKTAEVPILCLDTSEDHVHALASNRVHEGAGIELTSATDGRRLSVFLLDEPIHRDDVPTSLFIDVPAFDPEWQFTVVNPDLRLSPEDVAALFAAHSVPEPAGVASEAQRVNDMLVLGTAGPDMHRVLARPMTFLCGNLFEQGDPRNTSDGKWVPMTATLHEWIHGGTTASGMGLPFCFSKHVEHTQKQGEGWVFGTSLGRARKKAAMTVMECVGYDIDGGATLDSAIETLLRLNIFALIYTSYNHGTTKLVLDRNEVVKRLSLTGAVTDADVHVFLRDHYTKSRFDAAFIGQVRIVNEWLREGTKNKIVCETPPQEKFRIVLPLLEPVDLSTLANHTEAWLKVWERRITGGAADLLGLPFDIACTDPSRLFYVPKHPQGREPRVVMLQGQPMSFSQLSERSKAEYGKALRQGLSSMADNPFAQAAAGTKDRGPDLLIGDFDVVAFNKEYMERFRFTDLIQAECPDKIVEVGGDGHGKLHIQCPFSHLHTEQDDEDTACCGWDADGLGGLWSVKCQHHSCASFTPAEYLFQMIEDGWFSPEALLNEDYSYPPEDDDEDEPRGAPIVAPSDASAFSATSSVAELTAFFKRKIATGADDIAVGALVQDIAKVVPLSKPEIKKLVRQAKAELAEAAKAAQAKSAGVKPKPDRPTIDLTRDHEDIILLGRAHLTGARDRRGCPRLYEFNKQVADLCHDREGLAYIRMLSLAQFTVVLHKIVRFTRPKDGGGVQGVTCPDEIVKQLYHELAVGLYPPLLKVTNVPVLAKSGLVDQPGYDPESRIYYSPDPALTVRAVSPVPPEVELVEAKEALLDLLGDFRFSAATRAEIEAGQFADGRPIPGLANALALLLGLFVRDALRDNIPLLMISKPDISAGSTKFVETTAIVALGKKAPVRSMPKGEEEMRKVVATDCYNGERLVFWDNIDGFLHSPVLAGAATSDEFYDRALGKNGNIGGPFRQAIVMTGLRPRASDELVRRMLLVDIDPGVSDATKRTDYRYPDITGHATETRAELVWSVLTLIAHWLAQGRPTCQRAAEMPSFNHFCQVVGGVLDCAGILGFNGNRERLQKLVATVEGNPHLDAVTAWVTVAAKEPRLYTLADMTTRNLAAMWQLRKTDLPSRLRRERPLDDFDYDPKRLAFWLGQKEGALFEVGGVAYKLEQGAKGENGKPWSLVQASAAAGS